MALNVFNTLNGRKELFVPLAPPHVGMYVCGVTVYDLSHIGHARAYIAFDVIYRYLVYKGYEVQYVRNFTDIDDKIIRKANTEGVDIGAVTNRYIDAYLEDMARLGLKEPTIQPCCTQYIPQMLSFIADLVAQGSAYVTGQGDVYYRVRSFNGYGKLSGRNLDEMRAGASERVGDIDLQEKEDPFDFALWKSAKPGEPSWESPWGPGRPGWHIECSVMSLHNLGSSFDIHGGGKDLIFPHHENEIAQSEAHNQCSMARYWLHNGFINVPGDAGEATKMSKSLGNFYTVRDVLAAYHPQALKLFMLSTSYRTDILFTDEGLSNAQKRIKYFYQTLHKADTLLSRLGGGELSADAALIEPEIAHGVMDRVEEAMDDDFNTQKALSELSEPFRLLNDLCDHPKGRDKAALRATVAAIRDAVRRFSGIFGLLDMPPLAALDEIKRLQLRFTTITEARIDELLAARTAARRDKDWARSDAIRNELDALGILLQDSPEGTSWDLKE